MCRLLKLKKNFKECYAIAVVKTAYCEQQVSELQMNHHMPQIVFCPTDVDICRIVTVFSKVFTKDRERERVQQVQKVIFCLANLM
jgi:hypothetical protein